MSITAALNEATELVGGLAADGSAVTIAIHHVPAAAYAELPWDEKSFLPDGESTTWKKKVFNGTTVHDPGSVTVTVFKSAVEDGS